MNRALRAALLAATLFLPARAPGGVAESWYLARGRANMEIGNYSAAVEAYRKALDANPHSREASRALGFALLRNGETDRAVAVLDRHLARFPGDADVAFEQARLLQWSRYAYRSRDAVRYLRMGLAVRDEPARRHELARLLGRDRATLDEALAEYDRLLASAPDDRELRDERLKLLLWDPRRRAEAIRELQRRAAEKPGDERVARDLARLLAGDPARAAEAAERYEILLARHPQDPDLLLGRARALARGGRRAEARDAYSRALSARQPPEVRLERAELLASDPATADEARREYEMFLRASPRSRRARLGLARVLGARKETSRAAIREYEEVLRGAPADAEAHRGLARAYAWNDDADRALAHGELADRHGPPRADLAAMERDLRRGREPSVGAGARLLEQPGGAWAYSSIATFATGAAEPTPFTSSSVEAGLATAGAGPARTEGGFFDARGEWRPRPGARLSLALGWDGARLAGRRLSGEVRLVREDGTRTLSLGFAHAARRDSFRAYAGERTPSGAAGAASDTAVEVRGTWTRERDRAEAFARAGAVTGAGISPAVSASAGGRADRALLRARGWTILAGARGEATHHARDLSGGDGDPAATRVFSPPLFVQASPRLSIVREEGLAGRVILDAGPAAQITSGHDGALRLGGDVRASLMRRFGDRLRMGAELRAERVGGVHSRVEGALDAALLF
jgi:tetratricopeptide (TPR) repeat protein